MRKLAQFLLLSCFLVIPASAQRGGRGGSHGGAGGGFHGGAGGGFRGGAGGGFRGGAGGGFRGGGFNGGRGWHGGGFVGPGFRGRGGFRGYGFPYWSFYGGGWGYPYPYYGYAYDPYSAYSYPAYSYPAYSYPPDDYGYAYSEPDAASCPQANGRPLYQVKLTYQSNVWVAQDYWFTAGTLNFITMQGEEKKTPINSIDRALTFQLNRNCGVDFRLPR
jgi:hypothetical protein